MQSNNELKTPLLSNYNELDLNNEVKKTNEDGVTDKSINYLGFISFTDSKGNVTKDIKKLQEVEDMSDLDMKEFSLLNEYTTADNNVKEGKENIDVKETVDVKEVKETIDVKETVDVKEVKENIDVKETVNIKKVTKNPVEFTPIDSLIEKFKHVDLLKLIVKNSKVRFIGNSRKYCYQLVYKNCEFIHGFSRENYTELKQDFVQQKMHSLSGETTDLCYYTYCPNDLKYFLELNKNLQYSYLPITIYPIDSANGVRHDTMLIFDNKNKEFYYFDCKNKNDSIPYASNAPKNYMDILFINMAEVFNLGYAYVAEESWISEGLFQRYGTFGSMDFIMSTAWCLCLINDLNNYDTPLIYATTLTDKPISDRFHYMYCRLMQMLNLNFEIKNKFITEEVPISDLSLEDNEVEYNKYVNKVKQVNTNRDITNRDITHRNNIPLNTSFTHLLNNQTSQMNNQTSQTSQLNSQMNSQTSQTSQTIQMNNQTSQTSQLNNRNVQPNYLIDTDDVLHEQVIRFNKNEKSSCDIM